MNSDPTLRQSDDEQKRAEQLSLQRTRPSIDLPGYEVRSFLGAGAYGEVWVAMDENTGRQVAIKFYTHRSALDWSLLSREVEKLVFLSADRYVVQLLDVGWDSEPPYYVMEYIENGSLDDYLRKHGSIPIGSAIELFRDVVVGLLHAHRKGVLHCDLKPANILLDEDLKPRLADFGQSRLSHEQTPALGTLFYMAPEQADLLALPDAGWDVYGLGALLYCMLTGDPPYRSQDSLSKIDSSLNLERRLQKYREFIARAPVPSAHRQVPNIDRYAVEIVDRCLATNPSRRYPNVQSVLDALEARRTAQSRKPLLTLGLVGPLLLLTVISLFAWQAYQRAMGGSQALLAQSVKGSTDFAARFASEAVARQIERFFRAVEQVAEHPETCQYLSDVTNDASEVGQLLRRLEATEPDIPDWHISREAFLRHPSRAPLQDYLERTIADHVSRDLHVASWFISNKFGTHLGISYADKGHEKKSPVGDNWAYRTYFHGGPNDLAESDARHNTPQPIEVTHLSAAFLSRATNTWKLAVSAPVEVEGKFHGIVALTVELGDVISKSFDDSERQFVVLIDGRQGTNKGVILQHPLFNSPEFEARMEVSGQSTFNFDAYRIDLDDWHDADEVRLHEDPLGNHRFGTRYRQRWIASKANVDLNHAQRSKRSNEREPDTGLVVLVQEDYQLAAAPLNDLARLLVRLGVWALIAGISVVGGLWYFVVHAMRNVGSAKVRGSGESVSSVDSHNMETVELPRQLTRVK